MDDQHIFRSTVTNGDRRVEFHAHISAAALPCALRSRIVDQDPTHNLCGHRHEVRTVLPFGLPLIDKF
jgi:hypothetical protein